MCIKINKQEVGIWWVQKRFPRYWVPIWSLWPHIRSLPSIVAEKNVTKNVHICMFKVYKNQLSRQTGSRNLTGPKTLPTIWYTYMTLVTKYQISAINSYWGKCDEKYLGRTDRGRTVYPLPSSGSGGIIIIASTHSTWSDYRTCNKCYVFARPTCMYNKLIDSYLILCNLLSDLYLLYYNYIILLNTNVTCIYIYIYLHAGVQDKFIIPVFALIFFTYLAESQI